MYIRRLIHRFVFMNALEAEGGGGGEVVADVPAETVETIEAPKTALEAISRSVDEGRESSFSRDELGRFAPKQADAQPVAQPTVQPAAVAPVAPVVPEDDLLKMPEGLGPKGQERFQKLANGIRERDTQIGELNEQVSYVRETFAKHGVQQEQFEQAASVIGMLNRKDYSGALKVLDEQRRMISLAMGQPLPGVDALSEFPDLRQAVDQLTMTEAHAMEMARRRLAEQHTLQAQQRQQSEQQDQQRSEQAFREGQGAVDKFCKQMQGSDLDYPAIEAQLLPVVPQLLQGVPPQQWAKAVQTQYELIKRVYSSARQSSSGGTVLRPTGQASPQQAPKTGYEAMWGQPAPSA